MRFCDLHFRQNGKYNRKRIVIQNALTDQCHRLDSSPMCPLEEARNAEVLSSFFLLFLALASVYIGQLGWWLFVQTKTLDLRISFLRLHKKSAISWHLAFHQFHLWFTRGSRYISDWHEIVFLTWQGLLFDPAWNSLSDAKILNRIASFYLRECLDGLLPVFLKLYLRLYWIGDWQSLQSGKN